MPSITHKYDPLLNKRFVFSSRLIKEGDEIFSNYVPLYSATECRRSNLSKLFGFLCNCPACTNSTSSSDSNRDLIESLDGEIYLNISKGRYDDAEKSIERRLQLLNEENLATPDILYRTCYDGFQLFDRRGAPAAIKLDWLKKVEKHASEFMLRETFDFVEIKTKLKQFL